MKNIKQLIEDEIKTLKVNNGSLMYKSGHHTIETLKLKNNNN